MQMSDLTHKLIAFKAHLNMEIGNAICEFITYHKLQLNVNSKLTIMKIVVPGEGGEAEGEGGEAETLSVTSKEIVQKYL